MKQDISIGTNLKKYRTALRLSQATVAARLQTQGLDIHEKIISEMELGRYSIRISVLLALAEMYHVPIQDFFADLNRYEESKI
ncbi:MAG: helix-turn-helix domain-containing protein [Oscillospiraceae bacterium]|nr:helix-turn-helix domain-containing protein [Oscillospiraceae bacterium]